MEPTHKGKIVKETMDLKIVNFQSYANIHRYLLVSNRAVIYEVHIALLNSVGLN